MQTPTASRRALSQYQQVQDTAHDIEERVRQYAPLVKRIAYHLILRLPASVEVDDLIQTGLIGLMEAARNFDPDKGVLFETFASQRIRGAMLDDLRRADHVSRHTRRAIRELEAAMARMEQKLCRPPTEQEMAGELQVALPEYQSKLDQARGHGLLYYGSTAQSDDDDGRDVLDLFAADFESDPSQILDQQVFREKLIEGIAALPEREKLIMALYYEQELNLKEIGAVLEVSESRISQLHSQAISRLRVFLRDWLAH